MAAPDFYNILADHLLFQHRGAALRRWLDALPASAHPRRLQFDRLVKDRS